MSYPEIGVIGLHRGWSSRTLVEAFTALGRSAYLLDPAELVFDTEKNEVRCQGRNLAELDAIAIKKLGGDSISTARARLHYLRYLQQRGVVIFPEINEIEQVIDRVWNTVIMRDNEIPMPPTVITESPAEAAKFAVEMGDVILKKVYSTQARGMLRIQENSFDKALQIFTEHHQSGYRPLYVQKFVQTNGSDLGVYILNGELMGAYRRVAPPGNWITSVRAGGKYEKAEVPPEAMEISLHAASLFKSSFVGVDVAEGPEGFVVYEVSLFGGFRGLTETGCANPAEIYAKYALDRLEKATKAKQEKIKTAG